MTGWGETPLGRWANQPEPVAASVHDLDEFRARSARWRLEIAPRAASVGSAMLVLDRVLDIAPPPPMVRLADVIPRRRA